MKASIFKVGAVAMALFAFSQVNAQDNSTRQRTGTTMEQGTLKTDKEVSSVDKASPERRFAKADTNNDQFVDLQEFLAMKEKKQARKAEKASERGTTRSEDARKKTKRPQDPTRVFEKMDTNKDGRLSLEEYVAHREGRKNKKMKKQNRPQRSNR